MTFRLHAADEKRDDDVRLLCALCHLSCHCHAIIHDAHGIDVTCNTELAHATAKLWVHKMASVRKALINIASGNKPRKLRPPNTSDESATDLDLVSFPNAIPKQYPPLILIHVILLSAALVLLPQTPVPNLPLPPPTRGLDKPQPPFLTPFTARPVLTLAWACLGVALLVPWWAGSLRRWAHDGTLGPRTIQQRLAGDPHVQRVRFPNAISSSRLLTLVPGYLECLHIYCLRGSGVAHSGHFVWSAIYRVRLCLCIRCYFFVRLLTRVCLPGMYHTPHS